MTHGLPEAHPAQTEGVETALEAVYSWSYEGEIDQLRTLYANALERQWIALKDLDWDRELDHEAFANTFSIGGIPIHETDYWKSLPAELRWEVSRRTASFMLSNFLHGEQGALMVAAQLVNAVPDMDGKLYAATQTLDEARHVEVFAAFIRKLGEIQPIAPGLKQLLDNVLATGDWMKKAVGMQVVTEGLALYSFRDMRNATREPLLRKLLTLVSRDEARHTGFGIKYLTAVVPRLSQREVAEIEDFAFESARLMVDSRAGTSFRQTALQIWAEVGIDPKEAVTALAKERQRIQASLEQSGGSYGPIRGFVIPTLRVIGLFSDRVEEHFQEMFDANLGGAIMGRIKDDPWSIPEDLEAWVADQEPGEEPGRS